MAGVALDPIVTHDIVVPHPRGPSRPNIPHSNHEFERENLGKSDSPDRPSMGAADGTHRSHLALLTSSYCKLSNGLVDLVHAGQGTSRCWVTRTTSTLRKRGIEWPLCALRLLEALVRCRGSPSAMGSPLLINHSFSTQTEELKIGYLQDNGRRGIVAKGAKGALFWR
ncbi:hypothetical protein B0J17DRAFT_632820 [Rhizoctonia solani]|nr:hypothetical protein B0J17DRAFT_632820 [Rhizoctonia solani]